MNPVKNKIFLKSNINGKKHSCDARRDFSFQYYEYSLEANHACALCAFGKAGIIIAFLWAEREDTADPRCIARAPNVCLFFYLTWRV